MYSLILLGKRSIELQKWRNLRVSVKLVQNVISVFASSFSSVSADDVSLRDAQKEPKFTVSYLVDSVGIPIKLAESILKEVSLKDECNPNSVLNLLRSYDFTDSQISRIIRTGPRLLLENAESSLGPKLKFLKSREILSSRLNDIWVRDRRPEEEGAGDEMASEVATRRSVHVSRIAST
ncbi:unnamed protein product [Arabidopsis lyrata]|nr:unnamed protein product [Arabidopsis lyrata]